MWKAMFHGKCISFEKLCLMPYVHWGIEVGQEFQINDYTRITRPILIFNIKL